MLPQDGYNSLLNAISQSPLVVPLWSDQALGVGPQERTWNDLSHGDRDVDKCPYFAGSTAAATSRMCLAGDKPVTVSRRYAQSYCTSGLHVACSLYVAAEAESSNADPTSQQHIPAPVMVDEPSAGPTRPAMMPASTVEDTPRPLRLRRRIALLRPLRMRIVGRSGARR